MFNNEFYPTPKMILEKMLMHYNPSKHRNVLEPSGGKGDIVDGIIDVRSKDGYNRVGTIDSLEIDDNLRSILKEKDLRLIGRDFLKFSTFKRYDLVIMNPPFSNGDEHLLKAIEVMKDGGRIICILNAETIRNPHSNKRKSLIQKLEEFNAEIEYIENGFIDAERRTSVEVALIVFDIPKPERRSFIVEGLRKSKEIEIETRINNGEIISSDPIDAIIERYKFEMNAGIGLIQEYHSMSDHIMSSLDEEAYPSVAIEMNVSGSDKSENGDIMAFAERIRYKYWYALLGLKEFQSYMTDAMRSDYVSQIGKFSEAEFNKENIADIKLEMMKHLNVSIEDSVYELFKDLTYKHSFYDACKNNIHLYDGWKTNIGHKVNDKKVILPNCSIYDTQWGGYSPYKAKSRLKEIERCLNFINNGRTDDFSNIDEIIDRAVRTETDRNVEFKYFYADFYKKGTVHLKWKDKEIVKILNIFGGKRENCLPPYYGVKKYEEMNEEEKRIVNEFESEKEYIKRLKDDSIKLFEGNNMLQLMA